MASTRTLITNGHIITMDPLLGDLPQGDVLVEDGRIVEVSPSIQASDCEVIDATGHLVTPGLVDTHRHTWQSLVRGICADWSLSDYYFGIRLAISPNYTPEDVRLGQVVGAVDALNAGVTTILDFSHCNNTPDHSDAAILGIQESGIRAVHCHGFFESSPAAPKFGTHADRLRDYQRLIDTYFTDPEARVTHGVSLSELMSQPWQQTVNEFAVAREHGGLIVNHTGCVWGSPLTGAVPEMYAAGLLGPDIVHVHCNTLNDEEWDIMVRTGGKVSISVETELNMGMGRPVFAACRQYGIAPTLSADVISLNSGDLWHQMRFGLGFARWDATHQTNLDGAMPDRVVSTAQEAMAWVTQNGADALGLSERVGSLTPGKRADLLLIGGPAIEQHPRTDPYGTLVFQTTAHDVRTVMVDGEVVKRDGVMVNHDLADLGRRADVAAEGILERVAEAGFELPGTPPGAWAALQPTVLGHLDEARSALQSGSPVA
jgi:cytosine/adenosine deaminase-related metal-dependent hydrolase